MIRTLSLCSLLAIFCVAVLPERAASQETSPPANCEAAEMVQKVLGSSPGMTARFTQLIQSKGFGKARSASGTVAIQKPGKMRWEYDEPSPILIVADGKILWYYDKSERTAHYEPLSSDSSARSPAMFLMWDRPMSDMFHISCTAAQQETGSTRLKLLPRQPWPGFKGALLKVDEHSYIIKDIMMVDHLGNRNTISFENVDMKASPDPSWFEFSLPEGAQAKPASQSPVLR